MDQEHIKKLEEMKAKIEDLICSDEMIAGLEPMLLELFKQNEIEYKSETITAFVQGMLFVENSLGKLGRGNIPQTCQLLVMAGSKIARVRKEQEAELNKLVKQ